MGHDRDMLHAETVKSILLYTTQFGTSITICAHITVFCFVGMPPPTQPRQTPSSQIPHGFLFVGTLWRAVKHEYWSVALRQVGRAPMAHVGIEEHHAAQRHGSSSPFRSGRIALRPSHLAAVGVEAIKCNGKVHFCWALSKPQRREWDDHREPTLSIRVPALVPAPRVARDDFDSSYMIKPKVIHDSLPYSRLGIPPIGFARRSMQDMLAPIRASLPPAKLACRPNLAGTVVQSRA